MEAIIDQLIAVVWLSISPLVNRLMATGSDQPRSWEAFALIGLTVLAVGGAVLAWLRTSREA